MPSVLDILLEIFCIWGDQLSCSSMVRPRKLNSVTRSIGSELIFKLGMRLSIFRCL